MKKTMYRCSRCKEIIWGKITKHQCFVESAAQATDGYVSVSDAANIANVNPLTVYYAIRSGRLKRYELRGTYYVSRPELDNWMRLRPADETPTEGEDEPCSLTVTEPVAIPLPDDAQPSDPPDTSDACGSNSTDSSSPCGDNS